MKWLMKSEPDECSVDDVLNMPARTVPWFGVRNYQARNFMRDQMRIGDAVLFYHSSCPAPGIAGLARVISAPYPDASQFDPQSPYYDPKSDPQSPRWVLVDVQVTEKTRLISLDEMRSHPQLSQMVVLRKGNRLSITPVTESEWAFITTELLSSARP